MGLITFAVAAKAGQELYGAYKDNEAAMDEVDRKAQELFSQDMRPARQLPVIPSYWMILGGEFWYVTHDDLSISEVASTYLPVDRKTEPIWNKRQRELWEYQPPEFQFMATNYGLQQDPIKVESDGYYWGKLPNATPILMPQESVGILLSMRPDAKIASFDPPEPEPEPVDIPDIFGNKTSVPMNKAVEDMSNIISSRSLNSKPNYLAWSLGIGFTLFAVGGTALYFWRNK